MKTYVPEYYRNFKCIADRCKHSCCIGWEIDIDEKTLDFYMKTKGAVGKRLKSCISKGVESCFILDENERCPFLNKNNLCDIYIELGEENLCNICKDHPRFRNFFADRTEMGLGMCCEAAVDLILNWEKPFSLAVIDEDGTEEAFDETEEVFFALRDKTFEVVQNRAESVEKCVENLLELFDVELPDKSLDEWIEVYLSLEILDPEWTRILEDANRCKSFRTEFFETPKGQNIQRQLLIYFLYRHMGDGIYDGTLAARVGFAVLGLSMIKYLCAASESPDVDTFKDLARRYSAEIEYCCENTEKLIGL